MTARMIPMVHRMAILATRPMTSKTTPRTITAYSVRAEQPPVLMIPVYYLGKRKPPVAESVIAEVAAVLRLPRGCGRA